MTGSPTTAHPEHPWRRAIIILIVGWGIALSAGAVFAWWLRSTGDWSVGLPWERAMLLGIDPSAPRFVDAVMLVLPWLGTNLTLAPIIAVAALWLWRKHGRADL